MRTNRKALLVLLLYIPAPAAAEPVLFPDTAVSSDTAAPDTAITAKRPPASDSLKTAAIDSFNVRSGTMVGGGAGISLGGTQVFSLWKNGLPQSLADFALKDSSFRQGNDTLLFTFHTKELPDAYNMMFPLTVSINRLTASHRYDAAISFSMLSKSFKSSVAIGPDSAGRRIDISQNMGFYTITLDLLYGTALPERFFSINKADRTDIIIGVSVSPFVSVSKTNSLTIQNSSSDARLSEARDSIEQRLTAASASGIAVGWRAGIVKLRHLSKRGGIEGRISYCGMWSGCFRTRTGTLTQGDLNAKSGDVSRRVSYYSSRIEISFSLVRKIR